MKPTRQPFLMLTILLVCAALCYSTQVTAEQTQGQPPQAEAEAINGIGDDVEQAAEAVQEAVDEALEEQPPHLADPAAFRKQAAMAMLSELFAEKLEPEADDELIDLMPPNTTAVDLVNPGFEFTFDDGKKPGINYWIIVIQKDRPGRMNGGGQGALSDPIQGWSSVGCSGLESGRVKQWITQPDGCTGYFVAHGKDYTLYQAVEGKLQPSTRYTFMVEVFKRNDYKRAEAKEIFLRLTDSQGKDLAINQADYVINPADLDTGFSMCAVTMTTTAQQKSGDLIVHIGMNAEGPVRLNIDNARLWMQPLGDDENGDGIIENHEVREINAGE